MYAITVDEVLGEAQAGACDSEYLAGLVSTLEGMATQLREHVRQATAIGTALSAHHSAAVSQLAACTTRTIVGQSRLMLTDTTSFAIALRRYDASVNRLAADERTVRTRIAEHVVTLNAIRRDVTTILHELAIPPAPAVAWRTFPVAEVDVRGIRVTESHRSRITSLRGRWNATCASIDTQRENAGRLVAARAATNATCVRELHASTIGNRLEAFGLRARAVTYAVASLDTDTTSAAGFVAMLRSASSPSNVASIWSALTREQRDALIASAPGLIGNLNGVPVLDRVSANIHNATAQRAQVIRDGVTDDEKALVSYLDSVIRRETQLVAYDPATHRMIEMVGSISAATTSAVIYLPGTGTNDDSFVDTSVTHVADYLASESDGAIVTFVYKDSEWISWTGSGGTTANIDNDGLKKLGDGVSEFANTLATDPSFIRPTTLNAIGHSAGLTVATAAEVAGTHFDTVSSLSGSYVSEGWEPDPTTAYSHYQYDNDLINVLDDHPDQSLLTNSPGTDAAAFTPETGWTPHTNSAFEQHIYDDGSTMPQPLDNHGRSAEGPGRNHKLLSDLLVQILFGTANG